MIKLINRLNNRIIRIWKRRKRKGKINILVSRGKLMLCCNWKWSYRWKWGWVKMGKVICLLCRHVIVKLLSLLKKRRKRRSIIVKLNTIISIRI